MDQMHDNLKKAERDNIALEEQIRLIKAELSVSNNKTIKYKRIAKKFKVDLD